MSASRFTSFLGFILVLVFVAFIVAGLNLGGVNVADILPGWMTTPLF